MREDEILFENAQWRVTGYGLESPRPSYYIEAAALAACDHLVDLPLWPVHVSDKGWSDDVLFLEAFCMALLLHRKSTKHFRKTWYADVKALIAKRRRRQENARATRREEKDRGESVLTR